jgi:serine/threonine-protein kinase RsbW
LSILVYEVIPVNTLQAVLLVKAELANLGEIRRFVAEHAEGAGADQDATEDLTLAVNEAATNIMEHGYRGQPGAIEIELRVEGSKLRVYLRDQSPPFDPTHLPDPDISLPLEERPLGGMGIFLIKKLVDEFRYRVIPDGRNELTLGKELRG